MSTFTIINISLDETPSLSSSLPASVLSVLFHENQEFAGEFGVCTQMRMIREAVKKKRWKDRREQRDDSRCTWKKKDAKIDMIVNIVNEACV